MYNRYWVLQWVRRENLRERHRDAAMACARERERATGGHIWSRGPRGSQVTLASDGAMMMCSHTRSPPSIWEFLPFSPDVAPSHVVSLVPGTKNIYRRLFRGWERRGGTRGWEQEKKRYFEIIGDCRLSGIVPIVSIPDIERVFNFTSRLVMIFTISGYYRSRIFVESFTRKIAKANSWIVEEINVYLFFLVDYYLRKFWEWEI